MQMLFRYPGTDEYDKFYSSGIYNCAGCGTLLYKFTTRFDSGCDWLAFILGSSQSHKQNSCLSISQLNIILHFHCMKLTKIDSPLQPDPDGRRMEIGAMFSKERGL